MSDLPPNGPSVEMLGEQRERAKREAAKQKGILCRQCEQSMESGYEFVVMKPLIDEKGDAHVAVGNVFLCSRDSCEEAREVAAKQATAVRPVGGWTVFGSAPEEPRP